VASRAVASRLRRSTGIGWNSMDEFPELTAELARWG